MGDDLVGVRFDPMTGRRLRVTNALNKRVLSSFELDEIFLEDVEVDV